MKTNKIITLRQFIYYSIEWFFWVSFVFFIRHLVEALEWSDAILFKYVLYKYAIIFIALFIGIYLFHTAWTYTYNRYREIIESEYLPRFITFDMNVYEKVWTWKSIAIISKWVQRWGELLDRVIQNISFFWISVILTIYLLWELHYNLVFIFLILLFFGNFLWIYLNSKVLEKRKKRIELDNRWSRKTVQIIMSKMEILQSKKIQKEINVLHDLHERQIYYNKKMSPYLVPFFALGFLIVIILLYIVFLYFWEKYFTWEVSLWLIVWLSWAILLMEKVFVNTLDFLKNFTKQFAEIQRMWDFFDEAPQMEGYEEGKIFEHKTWEISLKNISYGYEASQMVFQDFSLDISGSKITALVWPSGGGKSTLVKLISGYIRQDNWDIFVDNQNLRDVSLKSYFADVGYLTQEPSVFDGTVKENLLYAVRDDISEEKIQEIISLAHCEFIYQLLDGLDTEIGERWVRLSGWQKQRLAIAKIFLKNPKIIILDEPTSALDSLSEQKITEAMHNLFINRTVIVIAHRLQTVKYADDIIVIENGKIRERGTHNELVKKKGFYKQMLDLQSGF